MLKIHFTDTFKMVLNHSKPDSDEDYHEQDNKRMGSCTLWLHLPNIYLGG